VFSENQPYAIVFQGTPLIVTVASNANKDIDKIHLTTKDVSQHQPVLVQIKLEVMLILKTAMHAELVKSHSFQDQIDQNATDQDQLALVPNNTHLMVTVAFHASQDMYLITKE